MPSQTDKLKDLLDEHFQKHLYRVNEQITSMFLFGFLAGILASCTGLLGFLSGAFIGIVLAKKYDMFSTDLILTISNYIGKSSQALWFAADRADAKNES